MRPIVLHHSLDLKQLLKLPKIDDRETLADEIQMRLTTWLRQTAEVQGNDLEPNRPFAEYGLDSLSAMELIAQLEDALGLKLSPTIAWTYPTPASLARHLSELIISSNGPFANRHSASRPRIHSINSCRSLNKCPRTKSPRCSQVDRPETPQ